MKKSAAYIGEQIDQMANQGYLGPDEYEALTAALDSLKSFMDDGYRLHSHRINSHLPPELRYTVRGEKALIAKVNRFAAENDAEGLLRFAGFTQRNEDEGESA